jgi:hypothetical protein
VFPGAELAAPLTTATGLLTPRCVFVVSFDGAGLAAAPPSLTLGSLPARTTVPPQEAELAVLCLPLEWAFHQTLGRARLNMGEVGSVRHDDTPSLRCGCCRCRRRFGGVGGDGVSIVVDRVEVDDFCS